VHPVEGGEVARAECRLTAKPGESQTAHVDKAFAGACMSLHISVAGFEYATITNDATNRRVVTTRMRRHSGAVVAAS
jgi:hypothetical protein